MKKIVFCMMLGFGTLASVASLQSCTTLASSDIGLPIVKNILTQGITKATSTYGNEKALLQNNILDKALPPKLKQINDMLVQIAPDLVQKERKYLAKAAAYTVNIADPILKTAVSNLSSEDVKSVMNGEKGAATKILKERTFDQLVTAIQPKVNEKLNEFGLSQAINTALKGQSLLGSLLGSSKNLASDNFSNLASQQLVNGLFMIMEDYEVENNGHLLKSIKSL